MAQYGYPPIGPPKPTASGGDIAVSVTALILTVLLGAVASLFGLFSLAFIDSCPPASCSVEGAVTAVMLALGVAAVIGVVGVVVTVVQLFRRKRSWPFAVATLALCTITVFLGSVGYVLAVG
ncbi:hypothetical protein [Mycobacterium sp. 29Ha]|uniref:hypothetical protein n=1 Tax=Mycobacterium sp. 29Ha TaxID=2939268 RepID=UPI002938FE85|nr:hypothetical protein [Mycobacterium sp. 29Ha]MDV3135140.1 hypothetical protein [Mycobacterium sp. 29Ha]